MGRIACMNEFDLIDELLSEQDTLPDSVIVGPGDDGAVQRLPEALDQVLTTDTLVAGRHFPNSMPAYLLARRALAVNLSDLAAMGAEPGACLVALTHPELDADWARAFARGLAAEARDTGAHLVGGNLARGPLSVTVTATGTVPRDEALLRSGGRPGDLLYVSGELGAARCALDMLLGETGLLASLDPEAIPEHLAAYLTPTPRLALGRALRERASACIDVSDGLMADLGHLCRASNVGARVMLERLPAVGDAALAAVAGDDYELLFALPPELEGDLSELIQLGGVPLQRIGRLVDAGDILLIDGDGETVPVPEPGWSHF